MPEKYMKLPLQMAIMVCLLWTEKKILFRLKFESSVHLCLAVIFENGV